MVYPQEREFDWPSAPYLGTFLARPLTADKLMDWLPLGQGSAPIPGTMMARDSMVMEPTQDSFLSQPSSGVVKAGTMIDHQHRCFFLDQDGT